jgi:ribose transport system permease protein
MAKTDNLDNALPVEAPSPDAVAVTADTLHVSRSGAVAWPQRAVAALPRFGTILALLALIALFAGLKPGTFPTVSNTLVVLDQASVLAMIAGGLTICLVLNEFDLSIGYTVTLSGIIATYWLDTRFSLGVSILLALGSGLAIGFVNGVLVSYGRINAFIATLGTGSIIQGLILLITGGASTQVTNQNFDNIGQAKFLRIPIPVLIALGLLIFLWAVLNKTEAGRRIDATGGNPEAARLSGIRVARYRLLGFMFSGLASGLAGLVLAAELGAGYSDAGTSFLLQAFTACFLGAVTLRDGEFHILGTAIGVLILSVAFDGLAQLGVAAYWQNIAQGGILVGAVGMAGLSGRMGFLRRRKKLPTRAAPAAMGV